MRKLLSTAVFCLLMLTLVSTAQAKVFTLNYTSFDKITDIYAVVDQGSVIDLSTLGFTETTSTFSNADSWTGDLPTGSEYTFYFRVESGTEPEGSGLISFLADIIGPNSSTMTSSTWRVATSMFSLYPNDAVEWGANDGTLFTQVTGIDALAQWISSAAAPGDAGPYDAMYVGVSIMDTPIPGAVWIMGSGLIGLLGLRRLRKF